MSQQSGSSTRSAASSPLKSTNGPKSANPLNEVEFASPSTFAEINTTFFPPAGPGLHNNERNHPSVFSLAFLSTISTNFSVITSLYVHGNTITPPCTSPAFKTSHIKTRHNPQIIQPHFQRRKPIYMLSLGSGNNNTPVSKNFIPHHIVRTHPNLARVPTKPAPQQKPADADVPLPRAGTLHP